MKKRGGKARERKREGKRRNPKDGEKKRKALNQLVYFALLVFVIDYPRLAGREQSN